MKKENKTQKRVSFAENVFCKNGIRYSVRNKNLGHLVCYGKNGGSYQFYAGTGKIQGYDYIRGVKGIIKLINREGA